MEPWVLANFHADFSLHGCPQDLRHKQISDHTPVFVTIGTRHSTPHSQRPIPHAVFTHPAFSEIHDKLVSEMPLDPLPVWSRWTKHKRIIRLAASMTRQIPLAEASGDVRDGAQLLVLNSMARAVALQDWRLAKRLSASSPLAASLLRFCPTRSPRIWLADAAHFSELVRDARAADIAARAEEDAVCAEEDAVSSPKRKKSRPGSSGLLRLAALWQRDGKRMVLQGVRSPDGTVHRRDSGRILASVWGKICEATPTDQQRGQAFAKRWCRKFNDGFTTVPDTNDFVKFLRRAKRSAPGPDGLPYAAWRAAGHAAASTLCAVEQHLRSGLSMGLEFSESLTCFLPKGECDGDSIEIIRNPTDVRPLGLKNTDNKAICAVWSRLLRAQTAKQSCPIQRGFVSGRSLLANVPDLDCAARAHGAAGAAAAAVPASADAAAAAAADAG